MVQWMKPWNISLILIIHHPQKQSYPVESKMLKSKGPTSIMQSGSMEIVTWHVPVVNGRYESWWRYMSLGDVSCDSYPLCSLFLYKPVITCHIHNMVGSVYQRQEEKSLCSQDSIEFCQVSHSNMSRVTSITFITFFFQVGL